MTEQLLLPTLPPVPALHFDLADDDPPDTSLAETAAELFDLAGTLASFLSDLLRLGAGGLLPTEQARAAEAALDVWRRCRADMDAALEDV